DLTRIGVVAFPSASRPPSSGRLTKEQTFIAVAGLGPLLVGMRLMRDYWAGDLMKGLVYTAIWPANAKHVANPPLATSSPVLADSQRQPVSVGAVSRSLRLPYETVRRHADALVREGICVRAERQGLLVLATTHERTEAGAATGYHLVIEVIGELRRAGVRGWDPQGPLMVMVFRTASLLRRIGRRPIRLPTLMILSVLHGAGSR